MRKDLLATGEVYHVFNRSIADYIIFNNDQEFERMLELIKYYKFENDIKFSALLELSLVQTEGFNNAIDIISQDKEELVQIIAYCLMPTHIHLVLKQLKEKGISDFMRKVSDGFTRYFNTLHGRKGPLWESKFKNVLVGGDEQLLHLSRYIHLNPVTASLIKKPEDWVFSSYKEYLSKINHPVCQFEDILDIQPPIYRKFVNDQISYQKELARIKKLTFD
ncbi:MAG: transposase [Candidatus Berkelbacteria bacterium]|nr:transposase [Candidatus Berkelbacteria bacterium]